MATGLLHYLETNSFSSGSLDLYLCIYVSMMMNDTDPYGHNALVNEFSIIIAGDLTMLDQIEFYPHLNQLCYF